jgi:hypothetical protein
VKGIGTFVLLLLTSLGITTYFVTRPHERSVDEVEARWIRDFVAWWHMTDERLTTASTVSRPSTPARNERALEPLRECGDSLAGVGVAPKDFAPVERAAQVTCAEAQYALDLNDRYGVSSIASTNKHLQGASASLEIAARRIDNTLVIGKRLAERSGGGGGSHLDPRLSDAASDVTGQAVTVVCWSEDDWPSDVRRELRLLDARHRGISSLENAAAVWLNAVHLSPATCTALDPLLAASVDTGADSGLVAKALAILGHAAAHAANEAGDEHTVECRGLQYVRPLARALGATAALPGSLAREAWQQYRARSSRPALWSQGCRNGGPLDLRPGPQWP